MRRHLHHRGTSGFTLLELLMVVAIISILSAIAYPALKTFSNRNRDANAATHMTRMFNRARDQARRRNRAMAVLFTNQSLAAPQGLMTLREGFTNSCLDLAEAVEANSEVLRLVPFGEEDAGEGTTVDFQAEGDDVGIAGWRFSDNPDDPISVLPLSLCISPDGAVQQLVGVVGTPVDRLRVLVQGYDGSAVGGWIKEGPARQVEISFSGGARMGVN